MKTRVILPSSVHLTIERRGSVCDISYTESFDPEATGVSKKRLLIACDNTIRTLSALLEESAVGLKMERVGELSVRIAGSCHMSIVGACMESEFAAWAGRDNSLLHDFISASPGIEMTPLDDPEGDVSGPGILARDPEAGGIIADATGMEWCPYGEHHKLIGRVCFAPGCPGSVPQ